MKKITILLMCIAGLYNANAQLKVGNNPTTINASSVLEVEATNKGLLMPRVALTATNAAAPLASLVAGMTVYNTATAGTSPNNVTPGYYYCDGTKWVRVSTSASVIDQTVDANGLASGLSSPNSFAGATFSPNTPANTDYIYVNTADGTTWTYNGSQYQSYTAPKNTPFYLANTTTDAGNNKTGSIYRTGNVGLGNLTNPTCLLDLGTTVGSSLTDVAGKKLAVYSANGFGGYVFYGLGVSSDKLQFHATTGTTAAPGMWLNSSNQVGINLGTAAFGNSYSKLEVRADNVSTHGNTTMSLVNGSAYMYFEPKSATSNAYSPMTTSGDARIIFSTDGDFSTDANNGLVIASHANGGSFSGIKIMENGYVGIRYPVPTHDLQILNDDAAKPSSSTWTISSDARLKDVSGNYTKGLQDILKLNTITYTYKKDNTKHLPSTETSYGFIAQDVQKVFPEAVKTEKDGYLTLNLHPVFVSYVNAIKELNTENQSLKTALQQLTQRVIALEEKSKSK